MTEHEIINYLKENKNNGIAFHFMPEDVRIWCLSSINYQKLLQFNGDNWDSTDDVFAGYKVDKTKVFSLPENFELKQKTKCRWVEFAIDKNGDFEISGIENDKNITIVYNWTQWNKPIRDNASKNFVNGCCSFGGWQYEDSKRWYLAPAVKLQDGKMWNSYIIEECGEATPVIPVKIRFWREIK